VIAEFADELRREGDGAGDATVRKVLSLGGTPLTSTGVDPGEIRSRSIILCSRNKALEEELSRTRPLLTRDSGEAFDPRLG
jgi:hypothetical protein